MGLLAGKKILVTGLLSNRSIAYGIARAARREGAELAFTYVGDRFKDRVTDLAREFEAPSAAREMIMDWWICREPEKRPRFLEAHVVVMEAMGFPKERVGIAQLQAVGRALKELGFAKTRRRMAGRPTWVYEASAFMRQIPKGQKEREPLECIETSEEMK